MDRIRQMWIDVSRTSDGSMDNPYLDMDDLEQQQEQQQQQLRHHQQRQHHPRPPPVRTSSSGDGDEVFQAAAAMEVTDGYSRSNCENARDVYYCHDDTSSFATTNPQQQRTPLPPPFWGGFLQRHCAIAAAPRHVVGIDNNNDRNEPEWSTGGGGGSFGDDDRRRPRVQRFLFENVDLIRHRVLQTTKDWRMMQDAVQQVERLQLDDERDQQESLYQPPSLLNRE